MKMIKVAVLNIAVVANLFWLAEVVNAQSDESLFWTGSGGPGVAGIQRADLNGNNPSVFFAADQEDPEGVIVDPIRSIVYWVDENISRIRRAGLDGVLLSDVTEVGDMFGLAIDPIKRYLYWSNATLGVIVRANLDLTDRTEIISGLPVGAPQGLALDRKSDRIYWVDFSGGKIMSADLSDPNNHTVVRSGLVQPVDIALDLGNQHFYWGERGPGAIRRGDLSSSSGDIDVVTGIQPSGIALDVQNGALYWADSVVDEVHRINLDGSGEMLIASTVDPFGVAVFRRTNPISSGIDHYLLYDVKTTKDTPKFEKRNVTLADQFDEEGQSRVFEVEKVERLSNPVDKNGEGINDPDTHYVAYKIKRPKDDPKHQKLTGIRVENQFGEIILDTDKPDRLLVPSAKNRENPVPPLNPGAEHFKCYKVKVTEGTPAFVPLQVTVADQFEQAALLDVQKPERLCNPVDKDGGGIVNPDGHLLCYKVKRAEGEPKFVKVKGIHVNNQFGPLQLDAEKEKELCVPSEKDISGATPLDDDDDDDDDD